MKVKLQETLKIDPVMTSAPCRVDMGGTLDLAVFYNPLRHLSPCTFNLAIDLRTSVRLLPHRSGRVKITSRGFESADYPSDRAPFNHPLGLPLMAAPFVALLQWAAPGAAPDLLLVGPFVDVLPQQVVAEVIQLMRIQALSL